VVNELISTVEWEE